mmetsp:Transcript_30629/g.86630  ORF Transcript_30629/g.86630 Transcript_30629/m.86630 type:complete len:220 (+) Transcript_30629:1220-1879(+)
MEAFWALECQALHASHCEDRLAHGVAVLRVVNYHLRLCAANGKDLPHLWVEGNGVHTLGGASDNAAVVKGIVIEGGTAGITTGVCLVPAGTKGAGSHRRRVRQHVRQPHIEGPNVALMGADVEHLPVLTDVDGSDGLSLEVASLRDIHRLERRRRLRTRLALVIAICGKANVPHPYSSVLAADQQHPHTVVVAVVLRYRALVWMAHGGVVGVLGHALLP